MQYTETRAADRKKMAAIIEKLAIECGASVERSRYTGPREIALNISTPHGLEVTVDFDGDSAQPNVHVLSWHMAIGSELTLDNAVFGGNVNPFHHRKATYIATGFDDLCEKLKRGLDMAVSGTAFREPIAA